MTPKNSIQDFTDDREYLKAVLETAANGIISINPKGIVSSFNKAAEEIFGFEASEVIGNNIKMLMPSPYQEEHDGYLKNYLKSNNPKIIGISSRELKGQRKTGEVFPMELSVSEVIIKDDHFFVGIVTDISKRKEDESTYRLNAHALETSLNEIYLFDSKTLLFSYVNLGARENLGYSMNELTQMTPLDLNEEFTLETFRKALEPLEKGHAEKIVLYGVHKRKDRSHYDVEVHLQLVPFEDKKVFSAIVLDITSQKMAAAEREKLIKSLRESNQELDDFAYIASHDLKEPLRGLSNNAQYVIEDHSDQLDEEAIRRLERMCFLCQSMENLIDDLLYFSRIGRQELAIQRTNLEAIVEEITQTLLPDSEEDIKVTIPNPLPELVCDSVRIKEVFRNLITNAIKYNDKKAKRIEIGYLAVYQEKQNVFYVQDNGMGILPEYYQDVFKIFKRLNQEDDDKKGTGVGLTFVKKIIDRHGGEIWLESEKGRGTTFYFIIEGDVYDTRSAA